MTTALEVKREAQVTRVLELYLSGEAKSIKEACEVAKVPRSTYYNWQKQGIFDELLAQMKQANITEVMTQGTNALPAIMKAIITDATDKELSARDRDQARRTLAIYMEKFGGQISPPATGQPAAEWLKEHGGRFTPIQIVGSRVVIQQPDGGTEVVDGEAKEID